MENGDNGSYAEEIKLYLKGDRGRESHILGDTALKLRPSNEALTNRTESRLVFDNLRERVE